MKVGNKQNLYLYVALKLASEWLGEFRLQVLPTEWRLIRPVDTGQRQKAVASIAGQSLNLDLPVFREEVVIQAASLEELVNKLLGVPK